MRRRLNDFWFFGSLVGVCILLAAGLIVHTVWQERSWEHYKADHHCTETGKTKITTETQCHPTSNGGVVCIPQAVEKVQWAGEGEERVWR